MQLESVCSIPLDELLLTRLAFTPDGHHIVVGRRNLEMYGILSGKAVRSFPFELFAGSAVFSPNGKYLACVNENDNHPRTPGLAKVFETASGETILEARTDFPIETACFVGGPDCTLFLYKDSVLDHSGGLLYRRSRIRACRLPSGELTSELDLPDWNVRGLAAADDAVSIFGTDSRPAAVPVEGAEMVRHAFKTGIYSFRTGSWQMERSLGTGIGAFAFSPDASLLALERVSFEQNSRYISVFRADRQEETFLLTLGPGVVPAFSFSSDSAVFACLSEEPGTSDGVLRIWDSASLELVAQAPFGAQYHSVAANWKTCRIAALGGGKCDIGLVHV